MWLTSVPSLVSANKITNEEQLLLENKVNSVQRNVFINDGTPGGTTKAYQNITTYPDGSMSILQKNLNSLGESYFNSRVDNSIYSYYVYDKNNLEKTHKANDEIEIAKKRFGKILYKITEKVIYHMI